MVAVHIAIWQELFWGGKRGLAHLARVGLSPYLGEMENAGSLAARNDLKGLRRVVVTCPETELSPGITVPLILQNPSLYFWRKC